MPEFSIVIPCFNSAATIKSALLACLKQRHSDFEVIIVDDCSTDDSKDIIDELSSEFAQKNCALILLKNKKNRGASFCRNIAWDLASGEYICFLDADDTWHHSKLQVIHHLLESKEYPVLFHEYTDLEKGFSQPLSVQDFIVSPLKRYRLLLGNPAQTSCFIIKRSIKERFDISMKYCEDYDLWLRISCFYPFYQIRGKPLTMLSRRQQTPGGLSACRFKMRIGEIRAYAKFVKMNNIRMLFPAFLGFATIKHIRSEFRYMFQRKKFFP
jgi:teichuronic acid biosynthesis glycosyltransferase TuaG